MDHFPPAQPHGTLEEIFPDVFFVTGTMQTELMDAHWHFSRNMTVVRQGDALTLINSVRLDEAGLAQLESLGRVAHVVRLGALHGHDDGFYQSRYGATYWAPAGAPEKHGAAADRTLAPGGESPLAGSSVFGFTSAKLPECILHLDREGGILVACDALQNWVAPDAFFSDQSRETMCNMGFFQSGNFGPVWMMVNEPQGHDFARLLELPFRHALCGHGEPLRDIAREAYSERYQRVFAA